MNNSSFSLCLLPNEARIHVIKTLDYPELIAFSLISTKTKSLVQSFKLEFRDLSVKIDYDTLSVDVYYDDDLGFSRFKIYNDVVSGEPGGSLVNLDEIPIYIQTFNHRPEYDLNTKFRWANPGLSFIGWFEHLRSLFTFSESLVTVSTEEEVFDTVAIRNLRTEWTSVRIDYASLGYTLKICEVFSARTKALAANSIDNLAQFPQKFVIPNYDDLRISRPFTLDDALVSNTLELTLSNIEVPDLNRFIRNWVRGSNPRLKHAYMYPRRGIIDEKLLKGVQHQIVQENLKRMWNVYSSVKGGIDIRNKKGILATLIIERGNFPYIRMLVWS